MSEQDRNPYLLFTQDILDNWKAQEVLYLKVEELSIINGITLFELIPDSVLLDVDHETMYSIDSEDIEDMLLPSKSTRFLVHEVYLAEEDE
ncbi:hypothetical protein [Sphingobacterium rhinopitheci]|mgnify:CR=1 FL=1|uniref:hypothetical protein n=1 Tax=Sphingobacterium rhinopitheci TaxID=2781960 RepID=UPI001F51B7D2|nr:hypothetical protein [Sphingobacterium rhinopitheci]MCI0921929.1 hypothetical protein [Sphingobacterium rhinopitheci]